MSKKCAYEQNEEYNDVFYDPFRHEWYVDIQTGEWDEIAEEFIHQRYYIEYCPHCGRFLSPFGDTEDETKKCDN